jgi:hypothetical protein
LWKRKRIQNCLDISTIFSTIFLAVAKDEARRIAVEYRQAAGAVT